MNYYKSSSFKSQLARQPKEDEKPGFSNDKMEETDLSINNSHFISPISPNPPVQNDFIPSSHYNQMSSRNPTLTSSIDLFKKLLSQSFIVNDVEYTKISVIGSGSSNKSNIFKVMDANYNFYALKVVKIENAKFKDDHLNEIRFLKNFPESERIIKLYDYEISDNKKEISMIFELGDGDLRQFIDNTVVHNHNLFPANYIKFIWQEMLSCVKELHSSNYIHGNLRPENFVFVKGGLKLIDFGIVKAIHDDDTHIEGFGVPAQRANNEYRSPEILSLGSRSVKWRTSADVWSLGCILYELTYKHFPFLYYSKSGKYDYKNISYNIIQFPDFNNLHDVMTGCLNTDQNARYTIDDLLRHPFLSTCEPFQFHTDFVKKNCYNLAYQVNKKYNDCDFNLEAGKAVRVQLARELINGRDMVIKASRSTE